MDKNERALLYRQDGIKKTRELNPDKSRIITDPPYGFGTYETDRAVPPEFYKWMIGTFQTVAIFGYPENLVSICVSIGETPREWITWHANNKNVASRMSKTILPKESECIAIFGDMPNPIELKRERTNSSRSILRDIRTSRNNTELLARLGDVWNDSAPGTMFNSHLWLHPNEKPISIMRKLVVLCSNEGDTIIDPFMGSGTTGVACMELQRNFIGCEIVPEHFGIAQNRILSASMQLPLDLPEHVPSKEENG